ncbi:MAG: NAD-dependent epimerase/dehydratase family protein [Steroidobacteraceae bacterium]
MTGVLWITGVSGFTGRHLVRCLRQAGASVRILGVDIDIDVDAAADLDAAHAIDLTRAEAVAALASREPPDWVIHLAGLMPPAAEAEMWRVNVGGTVGLLLGLREGSRRPRIVSIGSAAEYAPSAPSPLTETAPCGGASVYGNTKLAQSLACLRLGAECRLDVLIARTFNLVGPGLPARWLTGSLVHQFRAAAAEVQVGNLHTARDFIDVRDAVRAYWLLVQRGKSGGIYNVSSDTAVSVREMLDTLGRVSGHAPRIRIDPSRVRVNDPVSVYGDSTRLREVTQWLPTISLEQSLRDMLAQA